MKRIYVMLASLLSFSSCGLKVGYLGSTAAPTENVDVYVDASAIKRPYNIVGKGYIESIANTRYTVRKLQAKAVEQARKNGADAVLFQDYFFQQQGSRFQSTTRTDTTERGEITSTNSVITPVFTSGRNILFLKYQ